MTAPMGGERATLGSLRDMRILVCGWLGSTNLGDELVFAGLRRLLDGHRVCAVSVDPAATRRDHRVAAIDHRRLDLLERAARQADLVILGGGGLIQDETSPLNLPYHLSRAWMAKLASTPWIGLGLGIGPLHTLLGRRLATTLRSAATITVRDAPSAQLLAELDIRAELAADTAFHLPPPDPQVKVRGSGDGSIAVSLRPWSGGGGWLPVGWRRQLDEPAWFVPTVAAALDRASADSGLPVRFVAMQTDRDHDLHQRVAAAMLRPTELVVPTRSGVLQELAGSRVVVAMRYHAGIGATIAHRPSVLIGYSPKVDALADTLGSGAAHLAFDREALGTLDRAILEQLESATAVTAVEAGLAELQDRAQTNVRIVQQALGNT